MDYRKETIDNIVNSIINEPEKWELNEYNFNRKDDFLSFWIANGRGSLKIRFPKEIKLSYFEKRKIWKAIEIFIFKNLIK